MAIFYLDYEGGNDANSGATFALRWKTMTLGATAARTAPGDVVRVMGSPNPVALNNGAAVNGTWTNGPQQVTKNIVSSTNATPIVITETAHGNVTGDTKIVNGHTVNTRANGVWEITVLTANTYSLQNADGTNSVGNGIGGATGTARLANNLRVMLASAVTANVAVSGNQGSKPNWTASTNVVASVITTDFKEGGECQSIAVGAAFVTGLAAYFPTGALNLSAYQQLSFRIKQTLGTIGADNSITLRLCSDALGVTAVDTFSIPSTAALNSGWISFTLNKGAALGASIQSIGFVVNTDNGAQTFLLDNIIACKAVSAADALSNTSLIGKNTAGETWCAIQSINGKRLMLDAGDKRPLAGSHARGYSGVTETVQAWRRETTKIAMQPGTGLGPPPQMGAAESGTVGAPITYSGGWNRVDMTTQTGETWLDGQNFFGNGLGGSFLAYVAFESLSCVRFTTGFYSVGAGIDVSFQNVHLNNNLSRGMFPNQCIGFIGSIKSMSYNSIAIEGQSDRNTFSVDKVDGNTSNGFQFTGKACDQAISFARNNGAFGVQFLTGADDSRVSAITTNGNATAGIGNSSGSNACGRNFLKNALISEAVEVVSIANANCRLMSENHDNVAGANVIFLDGGQISSDTVTRKTASGVSWRIDVTSANRTTQYPIDFEIARVAVGANTLVTVSAWLYRTNVGLTHRLVCKGGQIAGVAADVSTAMTAIANTWELVTITFTPTEVGVVNITTETFGGTTFSGYVDDFAVTQA